MPNTPPFDRLTRAQRIAVVSIVSGEAPSDTAGRAKVTVRTIRNWHKLPAFQEALAQARRDFFAACRSHLNSSLAVAFQSVVGAADHAFSGSERLKAALFLLDRVGNSGMTALTPPESDATSHRIIYLGHRPSRKGAEMGGNVRKCEEISGA
jgi:hypothetical protein